MKQLLSIAMLFIAFISFAQTNPNHVYVNGYYRSNGTYVEGHYRTAPNSTVNDNFSTVGNVNPYTGDRGYLPREDRYPSGLEPQIIELPKNAPYFDAEAIADKLYPVTGDEIIETQPVITEEPEPDLQNFLPSDYTPSEEYEKQNVAQTYIPPAVPNSSKPKVNLPIVIGFAAILVLLGRKKW